MVKASGAAARAFLGADGRPPRAGQLQRNPDLAKTFRAVAEHGALEGAGHCQTLAARRGKQQWSGSVLMCQCGHGKKSLHRWCGLVAGGCQSPPVAVGTSQKQAG